MAIVHDAQLVPSKLEVAAAWLVGQPWFGGDEVPALDLVAAYRFDDPAGEVGIQTQLVRAAPDGPLLQVPMTYRAAPLADAADVALMGEMEHSVLGHRWVYDGLHDPVYLGELVRAALTGGTNVEEWRETGSGERELVPASMSVRGSGGPGATVPALGHPSVRQHGTTTVASSGPVEVEVARIVDGASWPGGYATVSGTWPGGSGVLAGVHVDPA